MPAGRAIEESSCHGRADVNRQRGLLLLHAMWLVQARSNKRCTWRMHVCHQCEEMDGIPQVFPHRDVNEEQTLENVLQRHPDDDRHHQSEPASIEEQVPINVGLEWQDVESARDGRKRDEGAEHEVASLLCVDSRGEDDARRPDASNKREHSDLNAPCRRRRSWPREGRTEIQRHGKGWA